MFGVCCATSWVVSGVCLTLRLPNLFLNFSTPVCKMWIIREPKKVELLNKRNFEKKRTENVMHV
jgi:hypothetical protein